MSDTPTPMVQIPEKETLYKLEFRVVYMDKNGTPHDVAFHSPGKLGFGSFDKAREIVKLLTDADKERYAVAYEIWPILVSVDHANFNQNIMLFDGDGPEDTEQQIIDQAWDDKGQVPPGKSGAN